jgi:FkbM family methyltransferase
MSEISQRSEPPGSSSKPRLLSENLLNLCEAAFPESGFYLEAGANDGISASNTVGLDPSVWRGLLIEPSSLSFALLEKNRSEAILERVALVADSSQKMIQGTFADGSLMGSAHEDLRKRTTKVPRNVFEKIEAIFRGRAGLTPAIRLETVPTATLDSIIGKNRITSIAILILDVEGLEIEVLKGFAFSPKPTMVVIETRSLDALAISEIMLTHGYILAANLSNFSLKTNTHWSGDHQDLLWVDKDLPQILEVALRLELYA